MPADVSQQRIILHFRYGGTERVTIRIAAELAHTLGRSLYGVFLQDASVTAVTGLPFVREFRLTTGAWQRFDQQRFLEEQAAAVSDARRLLDEIAATLGVSLLFDTASGEPRALVTSTAHAGDIVVVAQPRGAAERLAHTTAGWLEAAHACGVSVLLVPEALARNTGAVATVVCAESDPALDTAARIAAGSGDALLLLLWGNAELTRSAVAKAQAAGVPRARITTRSIDGVTPDDVLRGLGAASERLVVLGRGACGTDDAAVSSQIAASRGVPVLVVQP